MITKKRFLTLMLATLMALGCHPSADKKITELKAEKPTQVTVEKKHKLTLKEATQLAETKFKQYLPTMLNAHHAYVDSQDTFTGDFTGDGIEDIAIYFSLAPNEGGNTIVAQGLTLYKNTGTAVKVIAGYEPDYLFSFVQIKKGKIYVEKLAYSETDGRCCPSIKTEHILTIAGSKAY